MTKRNELALIVFILAVAYFVASYVHADQRIFKIESYYREGGVAEGEAFLNRLHPKGSSLELFRYTMELSGMELKARKANPEESLGMKAGDACCLMVYAMPVNIIWRGVFKNGVVDALYDEHEQIVSIKIGYYGGL